MNTPTPLKLSSKYLSPCRTVGLKRKSTSRTPLGLKLIQNGSPVQFSSPVLPKNENADPKRLVDVVNESSKRRGSILGVRKLSKSPKLSLNNDVEVCPKSEIPLNGVTKTEVSLEPRETIQGPNGKYIDDTFPFGGFASKEDTVDLIKTVNLKIEELKKFKRTEVYSKKHDVNELEQSTKKWKKSFKEIVRSIQDELRSKGQEVTLDKILEEHGIPFDVVGFNEELMDFD